MLSDKFPLELGGYRSDIISIPARGGDFHQAKPSKRYVTGSTRSAVSQHDSKMTPSTLRLPPPHSSITQLRGLGVRVARWQLQQQRFAVGSFLLRWNIPRVRAFRRPPGRLLWLGEDVSLIQPRMWGYLLRVSDTGRHPTTTVVELSDHTRRRVHSTGGDLSTWQPASSRE